jgi:hypothetical protein
MKIGLVGRSWITALLVFAFFLSLGAAPSAVYSGSCGKRVLHSRGSVAETGGVGPTAAYDKQRQAPDLASWLA